MKRYRPRSLRSWVCCFKLKQVHLLYLAGIHSPVFDHIIRADGAVKKRRGWIVKPEILMDSGSGMIGIAIPASIQAAIVHTDINAGHTAARFPLILILGQRQGLADDSFQQFTVDAMPVVDAKAGQVNGFRAGFQFQIVPAGNIRKPPRQFINLAFSKGSKLLAQMTIQIHKADDTFVGMAG